MKSDLILPSEIPWNEIKGTDLEELLYWLFDSMGAKDLGWRIGGKGKGTADQGRDLELAFFTPSPDGTLTKQIWWVEAKGRTSTVEPSEVREAVINAAGKVHIEVLVVATNTNFSNPTRDWVKEWNRDHVRPIVKLWERTELENLCSKNPSAVIRLYTKALSPQGKVAVASSRLWDYASFTDEPTLNSIWKQKDTIEIDERALFALIASEIANGEIGVRSWAVFVPDDILISCLCNGLIDFPYLASQANDRGVRQEPLIRAISYLIVVAIKRINKETVTSILANIWNGIEGREYLEKVKEFILEPILGTLQTELKDVCSDDCRRVTTDPELLQEVEIKKYWDRLKLSEFAESDEKKIFIYEWSKEPCEVGFALNEKDGCPLCRMEKPHLSIDDFIKVVERVVKIRSINEKDV